MEKKLWSNAEIVELGVENTKGSECSGNFEASNEVSPMSAYPKPFKGCIWNNKYEPGHLGICKHYDRTAPGKCKLNVQAVS